MAEPVNWKLYIPAIVALFRQAMQMSDEQISAFLEVGLEMQPPHLRAVAIQLFAQSIDVGDAFTKTPDEIRGLEADQSDSDSSSMSDGLSDIMVLPDEADFTSDNEA